MKVVLIGNKNILAASVVMAEEGMAINRPFMCPNSRNVRAFAWRLSQFCALVPSPRSVSDGLGE